MRVAIQGTMLMRCDMVLGAQWLQTMGPILLNFEKLTVQFQHEDQNSSVRLIGEWQLNRFNIMENKGVYLQLIQEEINISEHKYANP